MKLGDVIQLRCGGPKMVIYDEYGEGPGHRFVCCWHAGNGTIGNMPVHAKAVELVDHPDEIGDRRKAAINRLCKGFLGGEFLGSWEDGAQAKTIAHTILEILKEPP